MKQRTIEQGRMQMETFEEGRLGDDPLGWLEKQAADEMILLAHAEDGIVWGRIENHRVILPAAERRWQPQLRKETLQMARLFDSQCEIFLWRVGEGKWRARTIRNDAGEACLYYDEAQILWGTRVEATDNGFSRAAEGEQGLRHAPPLEIGAQDWGDAHPLRLGVRHYLLEDAEGWLRVKQSRLTGVWKEG
jgi:CRISPR-associated protein (TIGR03984 family)